MKLRRVEVSMSNLANQIGALFKSDSNDNKENSETSERTSFTVVESLQQVIDALDNKELADKYFVQKLDSDYLPGKVVVSILPVVSIKETPTGPEIYQWKASNTGIYLAHVKQEDILNQLSTVKLDYDKVSIEAIDSTALSAKEYRFMPEVISVVYGSDNSVELKLHFNELYSFKAYAKAQRLPEIRVKQPEGLMTLKLQDDKVKNISVYWTKFKNVQTTSKHVEQVYTLDVDVPFTDKSALKNLVNDLRDISKTPAIELTGNREAMIQDMIKKGSVWLND